MSKTSNVVFVIILLIVCVSVIMSCGLPLFNENLTLGLLRTSDMTLKAVMGPFGDDGNPEWILRALRFFPQRDYFDRGILLFGWDRLSIAYWQEQSHPAWFNGDNSIFDYPAGGDRSLTHLMEPIGKGSYFAHINISRLSDFPEWRVTILKYDLIQQSLYDNLAPMPIDLRFECQVVGPVGNPKISSAHIFPSSSPFGDQLYVLCEDADTGQYHEYSFDLMRTGLNGGSHFRGDATAFVSLGFPFDAHPFYFYLN